MEGLKINPGSRYYSSLLTPISGVRFIASREGTYCESGKVELSQRVFVFTDEQLLRFAQLMNIEGAEAALTAEGDYHPAKIIDQFSTIRES